MKSMKLVATLGVLLCGVLTAGAEAPGQTLTVDQAVAEARASNLALRGEALRVQIKKRDTEEAINRLYPSLTVGVGVSRLNDTRSYTSLVAFNPAVGNIYHTPDALNLGLQLNAQVVFSWTAIAAMRQTRIDYQNSAISYQAAEAKLTRDVKKAFFQLLALQESIAVTEKQLANTEKRYREAQTNLKAGQASELTVLQAKVAWENRKPALEDQRVAYRQLLFAFEALLGRESDPKLGLVGSLDVALPPATGVPQERIDRFLERRLDVQAAEGQVQAAVGLQRIQKTLLYPTLVLQYSADPGLNDPAGTKLWDSGNWYQRNGALSIAATWKLDSFLPGSTYSNQRDDLADQASMAEAALEQTRLNARAEVMTILARIEKSSTALKTLSENVASAREAFRLTDLAYSTGARSLLEVQDAELQYQMAQLNVLNEKQLLNAGLLDLENALNATREEIYGERQ